MAKQRQHTAASQRWNLVRLTLLALIAALISNCFPVPVPVPWGHDHDDDDHHRHHHHDDYVDGSAVELAGSPTLLALAARST
jgi:hypothetical protein